MSSGIVETTKQTEVPSKSVSRTQLVQRLLAASNSLPQFLNDLLTAQAVVVAGTEAAGFLLERKEDGIGLRPISHIRPDNSSAETRAAAIAAFQEIMGPCISESRDGAIEINPNDTAAEKQYCLVTLLRNEGEIVAASAVITRCFNLERAQQRLVSMQLVAGYFELFTLRRNAEQAQIVAQSHQHVLQLATAVATADGFESAAMNLCNELATRTHAGRVTLGWVKGRNVRVKALSHTEQFDKKQELIVLVEKVMEECIDQEEPVHFDPDGGGSENVSRAAQTLSRTQGGNVVLSLPLRRRAEIIGVITLEFPSDHKLGAQASTGLSVAVDLLAPQLYDRYQNDRWLITKAGLSTRELGKKILGSQYMLAKLLVILVLASGLFLWKFRIMYHVSAPFALEQIDKRKLNAPIDGQLMGPLTARPGDHIKAGQVLVQFDDTDLQLQLSDCQFKEHEAEAAWRKARSEGKESDAEIALSQEKAAQAEIDKCDHDIALCKIVAPFDGVLLKGDLTDQIGVQKKQGDELFEVAPDNDLRAAISVNERDIQDVIGNLGANGISGQGELHTTALPSVKYKIHIERVVPQGQTKDGENVFTVYAHLDQSNPKWVEGQMGEARINIGPKPLIWIWTHRLVDYLRLRLWL